MLKAYFDDSSDGQRKRVFAIGGFVGKEEEWDKLDVMWERETGETVFHTTDCIAGKGEFEDWSSAKRNGLIRRLIAVINSVELWGFHSAIQIQEFTEVFPLDQDDALYFLCFQECLNQAATWAEELSEEVAFIFDEEKEFKYRAHRLFDHLKGLKGDPGWEVFTRFGTIAFESRKTFRPLQAADLIAYTGFRVAELWWVDQLNSKRRLFGKMWDRQALLELRENLIEASATGVIPYVVKGKGDAK